MAKAPTPGTTAAKPARRTAAKPVSSAPKIKAKPAAKAKATAKAKPASARSAIRDQFSATGDTIRTEAQRKVGEIGDEMGRLYSQATERALDVARQGKSKAADGLDGIAKAISGSADQIDDKLGKQYGDFTRSAAQTVANLAGTLNQKDLDELVESTRDFVRKSPAVAIGSAAVIGFMLARLLRGNRDA